LKEETTNSIDFAESIIKSQEFSLKHRVLFQ
jgi:hypothetical protein